MKRLARVFCAWCVLPLIGIPINTLQAVTCENNLPATNPDGVYVDQDDGTVTDPRTGLTWKRCVEGLGGANCDTGAAQFFTWGGALRHAESSSFAGYRDWRLPNIRELLGLVEECRSNPAINENLFPNTPMSDSFWSGSPTGSSAWTVNYIYGRANATSRSLSGQVRLVRGGH